MCEAEHEVDEKILRPLTHVLKSQSNGFLITKLPEILNYWIPIPEDKLNELRHIFNVILNGILLFDDIQDDSRHRRTVAAAHCLFGVPLTINASIHAIFMALDRLQNLGHPMAAVIYCQQMINYMRGQGIELYWREHGVCPTEEEYKQMAKNKYGSIVMLPRWMELFSTSSVKFEELFETFAVYLTIRDDYCNIYKPEILETNSRATECQQMKETHVCEDFTEGKYSWPVIHALGTGAGAEVANILSQRTRDATLKRRCLTLLRRAGSLRYSRYTLAALEAELRGMVAGLGGNPLFEALLEDLHVRHEDEDLSA